MKRTGMNMPPVLSVILVICACAGRHGDVIIMSAFASGFVSSNDVGAASATGKAIIMRGDIMIGGLFPFHEIGVGDQVCVRGRTDGSLGHRSLCVYCRGLYRTMNYANVVCLSVLLSVTLKYRGSTGLIFWHQGK